MEKTLDILNAVEVLLVDGGAIFKDGSLSFKDVKYVPDLVRSLSAIVGDAKPSIDEIKNANKDDLVLVVQKLLEVAEKTYQAFTTAPASV